MAMLTQSGIAIPQAVKITQTSSILNEKYSSAEKDRVQVQVPVTLDLENNEAGNE